MSNSFVKLIEKLQSVVSLYDYKPYGENQVTVFLVKDMDFLEFDMIKEDLRGKKFIILTMDDIENGRDIFPLRLSHIRNHSELIFGEDVLKSLQIDKTDLRLNIESELRYKLVQLRESYLTTGGNKKFLENVLPVLEPLLEGILLFHGKELVEDKKKLVGIVDELLGTNSTFLIPLYENISFPQSEISSFIQKLSEYLTLIVRVINDK